jgi:Lhr-like helicase
MAHLKKTQKELLAKLSITALNEMQEEVVLAIASVANTVLLSPTGTGKTVAFFYQLKKH